ncbi:MAG TPA: IPT/TIG domain-containing protein [Gemmatimonadales bacterium]|nr:IPT/TIG domain-containing protein [Gemmatimonadales bacterium]
MNKEPENSWSPQLVPGLKEVAAVSEGMYFSLARTENGELYSFGDNSSGELGRGVTSGTCDGAPCSFTPSAVSALGTNVRAIAAGDVQAYALMNSGRVEAWGSNYEGELGIGVNRKGPELCGAGASAVCSRVPVEVKEINQQPAVGIVAGGYDGFAIGPPGPIVSKLEPNAEVGLEGGATVTIEGANFTESSTVTFAGNVVTTKEVIAGGKRIVVKAPAGSGTEQVCVSTESGAIAKSNPCKGFTYTASQSAPEFGRCEPVKKEEVGSYSNPGCTTGSAKGTYQWYPGVEQGRNFTLGGEKETVTFETLGEKVEKGHWIYVTTITCELAGGSGEYASPKSVEDVHLRLADCKESYEGGASKSCNTAGRPAGEILSEPLKGELGWISKASKTPGLEFFSEAYVWHSSEEWLQEVECAGTTTPVTGVVIARLQTNEMLEKAKLSFQETNGTQSPGRLEEGGVVERASKHKDKEVLETIAPGPHGSESEMQLGLKSSVQQTNGVAEGVTTQGVEINTKV